MDDSVISEPVAKPRNPDRAGPIRSRTKTADIPLLVELEPADSEFIRGLAKQREVTLKKLVVDGARALVELQAIRKELAEVRDRLVSKAITSPLSSIEQEIFQLALDLLAK